MKRRDIYILVGLGVLVIIVAWYFLIISPKRDELAEAKDRRDTEQRKFETDRARVERLPEERSAARQATEDLLKINKLVPVDEQIPSLIIELNNSANQAGIDFVKITPSTEVVVGNETVVPLDLTFEGRFFDVNDFLYRVENYARIEGSDVNVSGRFVSVVEILMQEADYLEWPNVTTKLGVNTYMTSPPPQGASADRAKRSSSDGQTEQAAAEAQAGQ